MSDVVVCFYRVSLIYVLGSAFQVSGMSIDIRPYEADGVFQLAEET